MTATGPRVAVVGGGIIGACTALALARRGARVTVYAAQPTVPGIVAGEVSATEGSLGWINASWGMAPDYTALRLEALTTWRRWVADDTSIPMMAQGSIYLRFGCPLSQMVADQAAHGISISLIDPARLSELEPDLKDPPNEIAYAPAEPAAHAADCTQHFMRAANALGVETAKDGHVTRVIAGGDGEVRIETATGALISHDAVVLATGSATDALLETSRSPWVSGVTTRTGILFRFDLGENQLHHVLLADGFHARPAEGRHILVGADFTGASDPENIANEREAVTRSLRRHFRKPDGITCLGHTIAHRPEPADGWPVVGPVPNLPGVHIAVMHSGVTLGPLVGETIAADVLGGSVTDKMRPYRPDRFPVQRNGLAAKPGEESPVMVLVT